MASVKKFNGNLIIQTPYNTGASSNITLDTDTVIVRGNLTVLGNTTSIVSNNTSITDNIITLNYGETGNGVTLGSAGITVARGTAPGGSVTLRWYEAYQKWQLNVDTTGYANILTAGGGGALTTLFDDKFPVLGGNLNVNGFTIYSNVAASSYVTLQGALQLKNANVVPTATTGGTVFYANTSGAGTAGLYVVNDQASNEELITKRRAFGFSLIL
jgi:hypothetical protein